MDDSPQVLLAVNPRAGSGKALRAAESAARAITAQGGFARAVIPAQPEELARIALDPSLGQQDVIVAVGGDGTVHQLIQGILARGRDAPLLGILPAGTGNALALDLGLRGETDLLALLSTSHERRIDAARLELDGETIYAAHLVGWEAAARIARRSERMRRVGGLRYVAASVVEILGKRPTNRARLAGDAQPSVLGVACLTRSAGGGIRLAPEAVLDDGQARLVLVRDRGRVSLARLLLAALRGRHLGRPGVEERLTQALELELPPGASLNVDGEDREARSVRLRMLPGALRVLA